VTVNYTKKKLGHMPPMAAAAGSLIASTLLLLPLAIANWPSVAPSLKSWLCVIALGIFCTGIAMFYHFRLIARIGPAKAVTVTYLLPVFGMLWGLIFLHEPITASMITACVVILAGTALATGSVAAPRRDDARCEGVSRA
jgi:drug/metabolite transporter (DMT)-like permease